MKPLDESGAKNESDESVMDEVLSQHLDHFKKWLAEAGIDPKSNLGIELTKQTRLLFELEKKFRSVRRSHVGY